MECSNCLMMICLSVLMFKVNYGFEIQCKESNPTVRNVAWCPTTEEELRMAAQRLNCSSIPNTCQSFEYHCVRNWTGTGLNEVCAPSLFINGGVCTEYNPGAMSIRVTVISCKDFKPGCPGRYNSTEQFKYPGCYEFSSSTSTPSIIRAMHISTNITVHLSDYQNTSPSSFSVEKTNSVAVIHRNITGQNLLWIGVGIGVVFVSVISVTVCLIWVVIKRKREQKSTREVAQVIRGCIACQTEDEDNTEEKHFLLEETPTTTAMEEQNTQTSIEQKTTGTQAVNKQKSTASQTKEKEENSIGIQSVERQMCFATQTVIEQKYIGTQTEEEQKSIGLQIERNKKSIGLQIGEQKSIGVQTVRTLLVEQTSVSTQSDAEQNDVRPRINRPIYGYARRLAAIT